MVLSYSFGKNTRDLSKPIRTRKHSQDSKKIDPSELLKTLFFIVFCSGCSMLSDKIQTA